MEEIKNMETVTLEERAAEIDSVIETASIEELEGLQEEARAIGDEIEARKAAEEERKAQAEAIVEDVHAEVINNIESVEERKMNNMEIRNTPEYIDAYAEYIKTESDKECRALLTENVSGTVPVPEFVYDIVKTAWERNEITRLVRKTYVRGNLKVGFEISGDGAIKHTEAANSAAAEENLVLGIVNMVPVSFKKWISISDEALDLRGEAFLRYIYDEITYRIAQKIAEDLLDKIAACGTVATTTQVSVAKVTSTQLTLGLVASAIGNLSGEATNPVVVLHPATWAAIKNVQANGSYAYDPFEGLPVIKNSHITAFTAATTGVPYMIVGDFGQGALANFPNGEGVDFKFDDLSKMEYDLVRILGREYVAIEPVACGAFVKVTK
jgi:HK97 family phage major capsid protein